MRRKLTIAMVGLALLSIVLVGAGVLLFAQVGARTNTETRVLDQLDAIVEISETIPTVDGLGPVLRRVGQAFEAGNIQVVAISESGLVNSTRRPRDPLLPEPTPKSVGQTLNDEQLQIILAGEPVIVQYGRTIEGIQLLDLAGQGSSARSDLTQTRQFGVVVSKDIAVLPNQARRWFVVSGLIVLASSLLAANILARRFTDPIDSIRQATLSLASGDLTARVQTKGDDEVAQLGHAVNQMATDLERSRQLEQQFLLSVSHDLRTPLTAINGYAEALVDGAINDPTQAGTIISNHAGRLNRLVSDLLDLAKLDARNFRIEASPVKVLQAAAQTVNGLTPTAASHGLSLTIDGRSDLVANVDPDRLAQVLANLVENAIKFADSIVTVLVDQNLEDSRVVISVTDDGPGIPRDDLPHIFERLYVTQRQPVREESSTGLGLAIVRELTHAMGGSVHAELSPAGGTTMVLRFPRLTT